MCYYIIIKIYRRQVKIMDYVEIEKKWQGIWENEKRFEVKNNEPDKKNAYVLIEFPYPSGRGLHMGHCRSYTAIDAYARKKRLEGYNVMFPFGTSSTFFSCVYSKGRCFCVIKLYS